MNDFTQTLINQFGLTGDQVQTVYDFVEWFKVQLAEVPTAQEAFTIDPHATIIAGYQHFLQMRMDMMQRLLDNPDGEEYQRLCQDVWAELRRRQGLPV